MAVLVLSGVLALVVGGVVCVVWAARGGPRWTRVVSTATLALAEIVSAAASSKRSRSSSGDGGGDD